MKNKKQKKESDPKMVSLKKIEKMKEIIERELEKAETNKNTDLKLNTEISKKWARYYQGKIRAYKDVLSLFDLLPMMED